jgi:hypothetical protein
MHCTFPHTRRYLLNADKLWVSDKEHRSHYPKTHPMNKGVTAIFSQFFREANSMTGAVLDATLVTDFSFLIEKGHIKPQGSSRYSTYQGPLKHWDVWYSLILTVEGRSIRFEASWPRKEDMHLFPGEPVRSLSTKRVGIAATFQPGTA